MVNKNDSVWVDLYNSLYGISSKYEELAILESSIFDPLDELDSSFINGFKLENLYFYHKNDWINEKQLERLIDFKLFIDSIENKLWNPKSFDEHELWKQARNWALSLLVDLKEERKGWNFNGDKIIFLDD